MQDRRSSEIPPGAARDAPRGAPARGAGEGARAGVVVCLDDARRPAPGSDERRLAERIARFVGAARRPRSA